MWLFYFIIGGCLRRWFGGALEDHKILGNRGVQTVAMIGAFLSIYVTDVTDWKNWLVAIAVSCWLQFQFWSRQHGVCFDLSRGGYPDETTLKRYNNYWWHIPCDWMADKGFYPYYGLGYDFTYMLLRYTCPMIPMMFFDWKYILIGLAISPIYLFCWEWYESKVFPKNIPFVSGATQMAEVICGGLVFMGCYLLGL
jgi:hypothetical protein